MVSEMVLRHMELLPGDLGSLMRHFGVIAGPDAPEFVRRNAYLPVSSRTAERVLDDAGLTGVDARMRSSLETLASPARVLDIRRAAQRRLFDRALACLPPGGQSPITLAILESGDIRRLVFFDRADELVSWLMSGMEEFPLPEIPLAAFPSLSRDAWIVLGGLCDVFLQAYPHPDPRWTPGEPIRFTAEDLQQRLEVAMHADDSWLGGFFSMLDEAPPVPSAAALDALLWVFCNERLLSVSDSPSPREEFVISARLTWALRCLAWWDRGFLIREHGETSRHCMIVQASALWRIVYDRSEGGLETFDAEAVAGEPLKEALILQVAGTEFEEAVPTAPGAERAEPKPELPPPAPPEPAKPQSAPPPVSPPASARVCPQCRTAEASAEARFCSRCGTSLAVAQSYCSGCGKALRLNARFCRHCGEKVIQRQGTEA